MQEGAVYQRFPRMSTGRIAEGEAIEMAEKRSENDHLAEAREKILEALTPHVVFDGWTPSAIADAAKEAGVDSVLAKLAFPRGGIDAALYFHRRADRQLIEILEKTDLSSMSIRARTPARMSCSGLSNTMPRGILHRCATPRDPAH